MRLLMSFWRDERGSFAGRMANISLVVAIGAVALATVLDRATRDGGASVIAFFNPQNTAVASRGSGSATIDPTPTGSISRAVVLDPCTGRQK
jgi:hypothetical protein